MIHCFVRLHDKMVLIFSSFVNLLIPLILTFWIWDFSELFIASSTKRTQKHLNNYFQQYNRYQNHY
jgi:hypothetical protein